MNRIDYRLKEMRESLNAANRALDSYEAFKEQQSLQSVVVQCTQVIHSANQLLGYLEAKNEIPK